MKRHLLLSFAEAGVLSVRWSDRILDEMEGAIKIILGKRGHTDAAQRADETRRLLIAAFADAAVAANSRLEAGIGKLPDDGDRHVIATAIKSKADLIVTENLKDFPKKILSNFAIERQSSDDFIADTIDLFPDTATLIVQRMLGRFGFSEQQRDVLFGCVERTLLPQSATLLRHLFEPA